MATPFVEVERIRTQRIWLFFLGVFLFYILALLFVSATCLFGLLVLEPKFYKMIFQYWKYGFGIIFVASFLISLFHILYSLFTGPKKILKFLRAYPPDPTDKYHRLYRNVVEEMSIALGEKGVKAFIYNSTAINAVSVKSVWGESFFVVSEGAISRLSRAQLQSLVAQGIARCATGEAFLNTVACCIGGFFSSMEEDAAERIEFSEWGAYLLVVKLSLSLTRALYTLVFSFLSQEYGLLADAVSVRLTRDPLSLAETFYISYHGWRGQKPPDEWLVPLFALPPMEKETKKMFSHPPTEQRIQVLLEFAHERQSVLKQALRKFFHFPPIYSGETPTFVSEFPELYVKAGDQWKGPFSLKEFATLPFLSPNTLVRFADSQAQVFSLRELPLLQTVRKYGEGEGFLKCPDCQVLLVTGEKLGKKVLTCLFCKGVFLKQKVLKVILARREVGYSKSVVEKLKELPSYKERKEFLESNRQRRPCPKCQKIMTTRFYSAVMPVVVEKCFVCGHMWLDYEELELLHLLHEIQFYNQHNPWGKKIQLGEEVWHFAR